jgi:Fe-S-cluster containining protein
MKRADIDHADGVLAQVYDGLSELLAGSSCPRSTRCCRFAQTGRTPYLWPVEVRRVLKAIDRRGGRLPREGAPGDCPLLLKDGGCSIYNDRPFGCRTYFCKDATLPQGSRRSEIDALSRQLRVLSESLGEAELVTLTTALEKSFDRDGRRIRARR